LKWKGKEVKFAMKVWSKWSRGGDWGGKKKKRGVPSLGIRKNNWGGGQKDQQGPTGVLKRQGKEKSNVNGENQKKGGGGGTRVGLTHCF